MPPGWESTHWWYGLAKDVGVLSRYSRRYAWSMTRSNDVHCN